MNAITLPLHPDAVFADGSVIHSRRIRLCPEPFSCCRQQYAAIHGASSRAPICLLDLLT